MRRLNDGNASITYSRIISIWMRLEIGRHVSDRVRKVAGVDVFERPSFAPNKMLVTCQCCPPTSPLLGRNRNQRRARRCPKPMPRIPAFARSAPSVRFIFSAITASGVPDLECAVSTRTSLFVQGVPPPVFFCAITLHLWVETVSPPDGGAAENHCKPVGLYNASVVRQYSAR